MITCGNYSIVRVKNGYELLYGKKFLCCGSIAECIDELIKELTVLRKVK